jgi:hypothetical protein
MTPENIHMLSTNESKFLYIYYTSFITINQIVHSQLYIVS